MSDRDYYDGVESGREESAEEIARLRARVHILEMAHEQLQRTLDERSARVAELEGDYLTDENRRLRAACQEWRDKLVKSEAERDEALRDYHRISANHDHMHDRAERAEAHVAQLESVLREACSAVNDLNNAPYKRYTVLVDRIRGLLSQPIPDTKHDDTEEK